jgi:peptidyl-prolyl cis-trans isomerase C
MWRTRLLALVVTAQSVACLPPGREDSLEAEDPDSRVVAVLNGEPVLGKDFREYVTFIQGELTTDPNPGPVRELFRDFVTRRLLLQEASRNGITVDEEMVNEVAANWVARVGEVDAGFSDQVYEFLVIQKLLKQEVLSQVDVTLREMTTYFNQNADLFRVDDQARVLEILTRDRGEAERIRAELVDEDVNRFKELARRYSIGVTAADGGHLGVFQRGELPEEFEKVIFELRPGVISEPFQSSHGVHLFALEEWIPGHQQRFFQVQDQVFSALTAGKEREAVDAYVDRIFTAADVRILEGTLSFDLKGIKSDESTN